MYKSLTSKKLVISVTILLPVFIAIYMVYFYFEDFLQKQLLSRSQQIEKIFFNQNEAYLTKDHINYLKLNLYQQLRYSQVDYLGVWERNGSEIVKVGDGGLSKKIRKLIFQDKYIFKVDHLDKDFFVMKKELFQGSQDSLGYFVYSISMEDLEDDLIHIKWTVIIILSVVLWLSIVALILVNHTWSIRFLSITRKVDPIINKVAVIRKVVGLLTSGFKNTINRFKEKKGTNFSKEEDILLKQELCMKIEDLLKVAENLELITLTTSWSKSDYSLRKVFLDAIAGLLENLDDDARERMSDEIKIHARNTSLGFINLIESVKVVLQVLNVLMKFYCFDKSMQILFEEGDNEINHNKITTIVQGKVNVENIDKIDNYSRLRLYIAEALAELLNFNLSIDIGSNFFLGKFEFIRGTMRDLESIPSEYQLKSE